MVMMDSIKVYAKIVFFCQKPLKSPLKCVRQAFFEYLPQKKVANPRKKRTFATHSNRNAQMAESVDALVSNTSGVKSIPVRPRVWVLRKADNRLIISLICFLRAY